MHVSVCVCRQYINTPSPLLDFLCFSLARNYPECTSPNGRTLLSNPTGVFFFDSDDKPAACKQDSGARFLLRWPSCPRRNQNNNNNSSNVQSVYQHTHTHIDTAEPDTKSLLSSPDFLLAAAAGLYTHTHANKQTTHSPTQKTHPHNDGGRG